MKIIIPIFLSLVALVGASWVVLSSKSIPASAKETVVSVSDALSAQHATTLATSTVQAPKGAISVMIADTDTLRQHGLSDREHLAQDAGMLFIFSESRTQAFWMKDMHFPLDIVWIDEHKRVVGVAENLAPETYPEAFSSGVPVMYVLEVNAGKAKDFGIEKGVQLDF